jgi:predicted Fe-Mo cluster-binding NifX family protein
MNVRICIPSLDPGGPDGIAAPSFENTEVFDFYEMQPDGTFERIAQTRPCMCWGPDQAEAIYRRGVEAIIVAGISPSALLKFKSAGVKVFRIDTRSVKALLDSFASGKLAEIGIDQFGKLRKM